MTKSAQDVFAATRPQQGWQGSHLLVARGDLADCRWPAAADTLLSRRVEQFGPRSLGEDGGSVQRAGRDGAVEAVSWPSSNDSLGPFAASAWIISWSWANALCIARSRRTLPITII